MLLVAGRARAQLGPGTTGPTAPERVYPVNPDTLPRPVLRAQRATDPITIDGLLREAAWASAEVAKDFVQSGPRTGYPATADTHVRILFDSHNIYVGAVLLIGPDPLVTAGLEPDFKSRRGDLFGLTLDPFLDRRSSYVFATNPGSAVLDEQTFDNSRTIIIPWNAVVETKSTVSDSAWVVEMRIPLNTISFDPGRDGEPWGFNIIRMGGSNLEISHWAPLPAHDIVHRMSKAGYLVGLEGLRPGRQVRLKPFAVASSREGALVAPQDRGQIADGGIDVKYGVTRKMTLDMTYRTDFSQVDVDQAQLNLTRFSLFFPELRESFIENQGTFAFGDITHPGLRSGTTVRDFSLFHSRRVGLTDDGQPIPLAGGARLTGRAGPLELGLIRMQSERTALGALEDFSVVRAKAHILGASDVGVLLTERDGASAASGGRSRAIGTDANFRLNNRFLVSTYLANAGDERTRGNAGRLLVGWRDNFSNAALVYRYIDPGFNPSIGFVRRSGIRQYYASAGIHPQPRRRGVGEINPYVEVTHITDLRGRLETADYAVATAFKLLSGTDIEIAWHDRYEAFDAPFQIFRDVAVESGAYHWGEAIVKLTQPGSRSLSGNVTLTAGGFYGGERRAISIGGAWRPGPLLYVIAALERNDVRLPNGSFNADLVSLRTEYAWSTRLFGSGWVQYDAQNNDVMVSGRINLRYAPLSDVFLVYQERRSGSWGAVKTRELRFKMTRLFQL